MVSPERGDQFRHILLQIVFPVTNREIIKLFLKATCNGEWVEEMDNPKINGRSAVRIQSLLTCSASHLPKPLPTLQQTETHLSSGA